jgi:hypothetical protein
MSILSDIVNALFEELKYLLNGRGTQLLDTQLKQPYTGSLPLVVLALEDASSSAQLPGGWTQIEFDFSFSIYNYEEGSYDNDVYSSSLLSIIDEVRQYFELQKWQTQAMVDLTPTYGFKMLYQGQNRAVDLEGSDNLVMGYKIQFASIAFDTLNDNVTQGVGSTVTGVTKMNGEIVT